MALNDPYSRDEIDLKLENPFQRFQMESDRREEHARQREERLQADINRRDQQVLDEFRKIDTSFRSLEVNITWLSRVTMGLALLTLGILVTGAIKWMFH